MAVEGTVLEFASRSFGHVWVSDEITLAAGPANIDHDLGVEPDLIVAWPSANFLRGALEELDIPDCIRALGRKVRLIQPWGPDMKPISGRRLAVALKQAGLPGTLLKRK